MSGRDGASSVRAGGTAWVEPPYEPSRTYELRGTWAFVTWGAMITILLVPFTNTFLPKTHRLYSVMSVTQLFFWAALLLSPRTLRRGSSPILIWMAILFGIRYVYGWLLSNFPDFMADSTKNMIRPMLWAWVLAAVFRDDRWRRRGVDAFILGCTTAGLLHLLGVGTSVPVAGALGVERVSAFELNPNVLGVIYASGCLMALARVVQAQTGRGVLIRLLFLGAVVITLLGLVLTGSRSAAVFVTIGALALVVIELRRAGRSQATVLATALLVGGLFGGGLLSTIIGQRSERIVDTGLGSEDRARMAPVLVDQFFRSPIVGLGPENYRVELGHRSRTGDPDLGIIAHNQLAMFAVEMGLFGIVPFLAMCGLLLLHAWQVREMEGGLPFALALSCVLTACTTANIAFHWHFHFIVGLVAGAYGAHRVHQAQEAALPEEAP